MIAESALSRYTRQRDPKTGRFYSAKKANERVKPKAWDDSQVDTSKSVFVPFDMSKTTTIDLNEGLAAFDTSKAFQVSIDMRGGHTTFDAAFASAIEQLNGLTVRKPHTLRHGMTVKDPTPEQAKEIFEEARRLGIESAASKGKVTKNSPWIWYVDWKDFCTGITDCVGVEFGSEIFVTFNEFLAHMRGEDTAQEDEQGLTVRKLCDEVRANATSGI